MSLSAGSRLGPYEIVAPLGAGGMGEVYKAIDTRLDRTVAIKVLPEHVANDPDLKQRFEREARTVAALNHPHICTLHDIGTQDGIDFLVMEYLDGQTLAQRLEKGALPLDQPLTVAIEIADALDKAHPQGIVHRDLKPANIMLTKAGAARQGSLQAKLLDFGLAKPTGMAMGADSAMPTMSAGLTAEGSILGTLQYMAPEQLEGDAVDARTDIFAFGAVVYEMVTGRRAFTGKSQASLIAAILERQPPLISSLQTMAPTAWDQIVATCLAKDSDGRWQTAGDVGRQLEWIRDAVTEKPGASVPSGTWATRERFVSAAAGAGVAAVVVWTGGGSSPLAPGPVTRLEVTTPPDGALLVTENYPDLAMSPDGTRVVYRSGGAGSSGLFIRRLDQLEAIPLRGTDGGGSLFFSPDGEWVAFWDGDGLKKVPANGGPPVTITAIDVLFPFRGAWGPDDTIVFSAGSTAGLMRVSAAGGQPEQVTTVGEAAVGHAWPEFLPDGNTVIFSKVRPREGQTSSTLAAVALDSGEVVDLPVTGTDPRFVTSGHLIYGVGNALWVVPFDAGNVSVTGEPRPIVEQVSIKRTGAANFDVSTTGSLIYVTATDGVGVTRTLLWVDLNGQQEPVPGFRPGDYRNPHLSPDGERVAVDDGQDVWTYDLGRQTLSRLTTDPASDTHPRWTPDGQRIVFSSTRAPPGLFERASDGTGEAEAILSGGFLVPTGWTADGSQLVFWQMRGTTLRDVGVLSRSGDPAERWLVESEFHDAWAAVSPDGRWIAYGSNQTGRYQVYMERFPEMGNRQQLSVGSGGFPDWSPDGRALFYRTAFGNEFWTVPIDLTEPVTIGPPERLFAGEFARSGGSRMHDLAPDGERFLVVADVPSTSEFAAVPTKLILVQNFIGELQRLAPVN